MPDIHFFVDEEVLLNALACIHRDCEPLDKFVQVIDAALDIDSNLATVCCYSDVYSLEVNGSDVAQLVFEGNEEGSVRDSIVKFQIAHSRTVACDSNNGSGFANTALLDAGAGALISTNGRQHESWWDENAMTLVADVAHVPPALRSLFLHYKMSLDLLVLYAPIMYENIYFYAEVAELKSTGVDFDSGRAEILSHLTYLNDVAPVDFRSGISAKEIIGNARAYGVEISPESPSTHKNKAAMKEREINIAGEKILCEWHTKLQPTYGRIHFYARSYANEKVAKAVNKKVIVGVIAAHLTT
ncbi:hypothetical protein [Massilia litorea]|uniref:Uncharacterized protein n=1 Tax=Massilia litorea TaxID=2769491 RepID=A0A7L9U0B2_9BURK|nr:hypothetical protein [Massilia litorea]QOL48454.1 hypothetical protein LPB04_15945 [Massilia litorea]